MTTHYYFDNDANTNSDCTQWRKPAQQFGGGTRSGLSPSNEVFKVVTTPFARKNLLTGVAWMDGRSWLTKHAGTSKAGQTGKPTAQIEPRIMYYAIK